MNQELISNLMSYIQTQSDTLLTHQNYAFRKLNSVHIEASVQLLASEFEGQESLPKTLNELFPKEREKNIQKLRKLWRQSAKHSCETQMAVGVFDTSKGDELVGVTLSRDVTFTFNVGENEAENEGSILNFMHRVDGELLKRADPKYQNLLNEKQTTMRSMGAVKKQHTGADITRRMGFACAYLGWAKGFKYVLGFSTNLKSAMAVKKLGTEKISQFNVKEFQINGVRYFQKVDEVNQFPSLWIKKLSIDFRPSPKL